MSTTINLMALELRAFLEELYAPRIGDLDGFCAIGSIALRRLLSLKGIRSQLVVGTDDYCGHCWVEVEDLAVDVTATQFGYDLPRVLIQPTFHYYNLHFIKTLKQLRGKEALEDLKSWPESQKPVSYTKELKAFYAKFR